MHWKIIIAITLNNLKLSFDHLCDKHTSSQRNQHLEKDGKTGTKVRTDGRNHVAVSGGVIDAGGDVVLAMWWRWRW
jgi:hypothetical protein